MKPERIEFFDNVSLRFTPPTDLNDPFECKPIVKYKNPGKYIDLYIKGRLKIIPDLLMEQNPNLSRSEARKIARSGAKKIKQDFMRNKEANLALGRKDIMRNINKRIGILSLTEDPFNTSMWAHYAADGSGYAIEFDKSNRFFRRLPSDARDCGEITPVKYTDQPVEIEIEPDQSKIPYDLLFTKKKYWSNEREHRIIRELSKADQIDFESNIHLYRVPHEAVSAIIIGYVATDDLKNKIQQATQTWPNANDVKIKRVTIGASGLEYA